MNSSVLGGVSVGHVIDGRFPLLRQLGRSDWSWAYLTELDDDRPKQAAIKIFPFESVDAAATLALWDVARTLSHPHLMPLFHAGRFDVDGEDILYVVTEYADETLSQILPERPLTQDEVRMMLSPVLDALTYLDRRSLTHGHLQPSNIMVVDDRVKLSPDFGWRSQRRTIYDAPEASTGQLTPAADIWSLGILLVESLTQQAPAWNRLEDSEPEVPVTIPEPFFTIARECLRIDPAHRCSLAAIKAHLKSPQTAEPAIEIAEPPDDHTTRSSFKFHAMILAAAALVVLLFVAAFIFGFDLTPSDPLPKHQSPMPAPTVAQPHAPVPEPTRAPAAPVADAFAPPAAHTAKPAPTPTPAVERAKGEVVRGSVAHEVLPEIPEKSMATIQGHIMVGIRVEVDLEGNVARAYVDSPGPSRFFANQALHAAQSWKFVPAMVGGRASAGTWLLEFQFGQSEISVAPSEVFP